MIRSPADRHLLAVLLLVVLCLFQGAGCREAERWHSSSLLFFDTLCEITIFCLPSSFESHQEAVAKVFTDIETLFSPGKKDPTSPLVLELFRKAQKVHADSDGFFDITVGPLSRLWGFVDKAYRIPSPEEIRETRHSVGMNKVKEENGRLLLQPGMELDWGGIAKGLGVDLAAQVLMERGIPKGFVNAGGDLFCWGRNPENGAWKIGIKHPRKAGFLGVLSITGLAAATTGDYQRYFEENGKRYHHVFDPRTGYPAVGKQSVTVVGPETAICDALATALFISDSPENILKRYPEYGAVCVDQQGKVSVVGKKLPLTVME